MKRIKLISIVLSALVIFTCCGMVFAQAETEPVETQLPVIETQPVVTDPVSTEEMTDPTASTEPVETDPTGTETTEPTDTTDTEPTEATEPETQRPTEYDEPSTYSDYVSPAPVYTPGDQDYDKQSWENLALNLSDTNTVSKGPGSFAGIKNDRSNRDRTNPVWIVLCIVFWCLSLAAITFAILYKPQKSKAVARQSRTRQGGTASRSSSGRGDAGRSARTPSPKYEKKYSDDYNDGF